MSHAGGARPVADVIAEHLAAYEGQPAAVHALLHGTTDPAAVAGQLVALVHEALGRSVVGARFHAASVGTVTGLALDDGSDVVVKAYQRRWTERFLRAVVQAQAALHDGGLPCARPIAGPIPFREGLATIETYLPDPGTATAFGPAERRASAVGLARVVATAPSVAGLADHPLHLPRAGLYPEPHSPLFDFERTAGGAEWIDELAAGAQRCPAVGRVVAAHTDWAARNVRLSAEGVTAIYDLDSLAVVPLPVALGAAAVTWRSWGEVDHRPAPGVEEITAWLDDYPDELTDDERRSCFAHAVGVLAYSARCEHAVDPDENIVTHARATLRSDGAALLDLVR